MPSTDTKRQATAPIERTTDYSKFKLMHTNREQSRGHVETLKKAFEEVGNLTRVQPLLVNENFEIIDGQHRFTACKELDLPIYYTMVEGLGVAEARSMNILHRNWVTDDYAHSYANGGDPNYKTYIKLKEDYGFNHSVTLIAFSGTATDRGIFKEFKNGDFVVKDEAAVKDRLNFIAEVDELIDFPMDRYLARALMRLLQNDEFDRERMKTKITQTKSLKRDISSDGFLRQLEDIYNFKVHEGNRVRIY